VSEELSYLLVALYIVVGFFLAQIVMAGLGQRRQNRRIEQGIREYLHQCGGKETTKAG
jgi:hypothetical protein